MAAHPAKRSNRAASGTKPHWIVQAISITTRLVKMLKGYFLALAGCVAVLLVLGQKIGVWLLFGAAASPFLLVILIHSVPAFLKRRRENVLKNWGINGKPVEAAYFRISPRTDDPQDVKGFHRADNAHRTILGWLKNPPEPILILSGQSGTGKTSLLDAFVIPELRKSAPVVRTITLRNFDEPIDALRSKLLERGIVWKMPPNAQHRTTFDLLRDATDYLRNQGEQLLLVLDQFEELLILHGREPTRVDPVKQLLQALQNEPVVGLQVLICLRSEYRHLLTDLAVPPLDQRTNWKEVSPFSEKASTDFLVNSGMAFGEARLKSIIAEAAAVDETPGLIRPITLNLLGLILSRFQDPLPKEAEPGRVIWNYLRVTVEAPVIRDHAREVLKPMLTEAGTKRPRSVGDIAKTVQLEEDTVEGCLLGLNQNGLVRLVGWANHVADRMWEVSHDFVARLLGRILEDHRKRLSQYVRAWLAPAAIGLWLIFFIVLLMSVDWGRQEATREINEAVTKINELQGSVIGQRVILHSPENLPAAVPALRALGRVRLSFRQNGNLDLSLVRNLPELTGLELQGFELHSKLSALENLAHLEVLILSSCRHVSDVSSLRGLSALRMLDLSETDVEDISPIAELGRLEILKLAACDKVRDISPLRKLRHLKILNLSTNNGVADISGLRNLALLEGLDLSMCRKLANISGLRNLSSLQSLDLHDTLISDLVPLKGLTNLHNLNLSFCRHVSNVSALGSLTRLETLSLKRTDVADISPLARLSALKHLDLHSCKKLKTVSVLKALGGLESLDLRFCTLIPNEQVEGLRKALPNGVISSR